MHKHSVARIADDGSRKTYESIMQAVSDVNGKPANIRRAIKNKGKHRGFLWEDAEYINKIPNVLLLDIETAPIILYAWSLFKPVFSPENIIHDWFILSWATKWLHHSEVVSDVVTCEEAIKKDDKRICEGLFKLLDQADVVIAHNGKRFDLRKIQARFLIHGIERPSPYQVIDTLIESRKNFAHSSHRLTYLGKMLVNDEKHSTDFNLWVRCCDGDGEALAYMDKYCKKDVLLLEEVYMEIRGWIKSHPNLSLYVESDIPVCPTCLSEDIQENGEYVTMASAFIAFKCNQCGSFGRLRKSNLTAAERERTILSVPR